ncbi:endo alpha-1,4 polygalactosaminidase [Flavobacterium sp.]
MNKILFSAAIACFALSFTTGFKAKNSAEKMQDFIINISTYTRKTNPNFIIIPQNGAELAFTKGKPENSFNEKFLDAIDGFGIEELFYNETLKPDKYRLGLLNKIKVTETIIVSEFVKDTAMVHDSYRRNEEEGFFCFTRTEDNYHYTLIPTKIYNENKNSIEKLSEIKNFLYIINNSNYYSKSAFITALKNTNYDLIFMDLYHNGVKFNKEEIEQLKVKKNGGKRLVIGYMNIGAAEKFRYYWKRPWQLNSPKWLKKKYDGYNDEIWVEYWNKDWQDIIYGNDTSYAKNVVDAGFDGVYLDNVEAYYFLYND